jgi:hypothetical protein
MKETDDNFSDIIVIMVYFKCVICKRNCERIAPLYLHQVGGIFQIKICRKILNITLDVIERNAKPGMREHDVVKESLGSAL